MEALGLMFEVQKQTDKRLEHLENNMTIDTTQQYHLEKMAKNKVIKLLGGKNSSAYLKYSKKGFLLNCGGIIKIILRSHLIEIL